MATLPKEKQKKAYEESKLSQLDKDYLHSDIKSEYKASKLRQGGADHYDPYMEGMDKDLYNPSETISKQRHLLDPISKSTNIRAV